MGLTCSHPCYYPSIAWLLPFQACLEKSLSRLVKRPFWSSCYAMRQLIACQAFRLVCVKSMDSTVSIQRSWGFSSKPFIKPLTFNWLTLTSEIHFVKFHPEVASCLLSKGKRKYAPPGDEAIIKIYKLFFGIPMNFTFLVISPKLQRIWSWNFGFATRTYWYQKMYYFRLSPGDENMVGIRSFECKIILTENVLRCNLAPLLK